MFRRTQKKYQERVFRGSKPLNIPIGLELESGQYFFVDRGTSSQFGLFNYVELQEEIGKFLFNKLYKAVLQLQPHNLQSSFVPPEYPAQVPKLHRVKWKNLIFYPLYVKVRYLPEKPEETLWTYGFGKTLRVKGAAPYEVMLAEVKKFVDPLYRSFMIKEGLVGD